MEKKNYSELTETFFTEFEETLHKKLLIQKISLIVSVVSAAAFLIFGLVQIDGIGEILFTVSFFLLVAGLITNKIARKNVKSEMAVQQDRFFDDVYVQIIADEIGAEAVSLSSTNTKFKKAKAFPGQEINSKAVTFSGEYNGYPYSFSKAAQTVVDGITYKADNKRVVSYRTKNFEGPLKLSCTVRRKADSKINIASYSAPDSIFDDDVKFMELLKMDNKHFNFAVRCNDDVAAYKVLTADVMEDIMEFDSTAKLHGITLEENRMDIIADAKLINLSYTAPLKKNVKKNIKNITADRVLNDAAADIEKIKNFLSSVPLTPCNN